MSSPETKLLFLSPKIFFQSLPHHASCLPLAMGHATLNTLGLPTNIDFLPLRYFFLCSSIAIFLGVFLVQKKKKKNSV